MRQTPAAGSCFSSLLPSSCALGRHRSPSVISHQHAVKFFFLFGALVIANLPRLYRRFGIATVTKVGSVALAIGVIGWASAKEPWQLIAATLLSGGGWVTMGAAAVNAITIGQVFYLLNSRYLLGSSISFKAHLGNRYLFYGIGAVVVLRFLFTYAPPLQVMFGNEAIPLRVWPWLLLGGLLFFLIVEAEKFIIRSSGALRSTVTAAEAGT